jgi:hypothetical protein
MTTEETRAFLISEGVQGVAGFSESKLQEIRTKISERFEAERNAIVDRINRQAGTGRYADGEEVNSATARGAVAEVRREFEEQAGNLSNLVQYSNIVAGYLEITSNTGVAQNTESIFRELNDLRVPDRRPAAAAAAAADAAQSDRIERLIQETERRVEAPTGNTNGNVMMGVDQINQVLKYND